MIKLNLNPEPRILRQFAWLSLFLFPLLGALLAWWHGLRISAGIAIGALGLLVFLVKIVIEELVSESVAKLLELLIPKTVYRVLVLVTYPIGLVLSFVLLGIIYYLVFTPIGLVFRLIGRDAMKRKWEPALPSYWHARGQPREPASYFKLY